MTDAGFMDALRIRERYVREAAEQAERMEKAAGALVRIQNEMQREMDRALQRPPSKTGNKKDDDGRVAWLESFEPEGGLAAQVEASLRDTGLRNVPNALETLVWSSWEALPLFADIERKAEEVQLRCAATMDRTVATTRLVPRAEQRAYALQQLRERAERERGSSSSMDEEEVERLLVDPLPEGWHPETHNPDGSRHGRLPDDWVVEQYRGLHTPAGSWVVLHDVPHRLLKEKSGEDNTTTTNHHLLARDTLSQDEATALLRSKNERELPSEAFRRENGAHLADHRLGGCDCGVCSRLLGLLEKEEQDVRVLVTTTTMIDDQQHQRRMMKRAEFYRAPRCASPDFSSSSSFAAAGATLTTTTTTAPDHEEEKERPQSPNLFFMLGQAAVARADAEAAKAATTTKATNSGAYVWPAEPEYHCLRRWAADTTTTAAKAATITTTSGAAYVWPGEPEYVCPSRSPTPPLRARAYNSPIIKPVYSEWVPPTTNTNNTTSTTEEQKKDAGGSAFVACAPRRRV
jgi:hypothetical protein